jgi:hypothetical protein
MSITETKQANELHRSDIPLTQQSIYFNQLRRSGMSITETKQANELHSSDISLTAPNSNHHAAP